MNPERFALLLIKQKNHNKIFGELEFKCFGGSDVTNKLKDWLLFFTDLVIVNFENIAKTGQYNFDVLNYETYGLLYDWKSITHYRNKAFRKKNVFGYTIESNVS